MRSKIKSLLIVLLLMLGANAMAQQIQLHPSGSPRCETSNMNVLKASFSFPVLNAQDYGSKGGEYSKISMPGTVIGGNEGDPEIPVINELIAVPVGATPRIVVKSFHAEDYSLGDYGIKTVVPRQPSLRKDQNPDDVPFVHNQDSYLRRGFSSAPGATVEVVGTMRGVRLGKMTIEPVSYDPSSNSVRVFNDIEVEVCFDGADVKATEDLLVETYSPYFDVVYNQLYNGNIAKSAYTDHPDLYTTPVKMLVVTTQAYANSTPFQTWLTWKKQKGFDVDVQIVENNATASTIKNLIHGRYALNHPTFLVLVGDETIVTCYQLWNYGSSYGRAASDLEYASVDGDVYHDMFMSRMPVSNIPDLGNLVNKTLTYEQYTMSDPSYLNNVLLIAGADATWAPRVGRPTINYAADNYFNTAHGFANVYKYVTNNYTGCYNHLNTGVGFGNYTAHGDIEMLANPQFTNDDVANLTNNDKYFWFMANCCLTGNFKNAQNDLTCLGETMVRAANKGAFGYIGSVPETYWWEDYYFGVGAFAADDSGNTPSVAGTTKGVYDAMFDDTGFNTLNAMPFIGNVAVSYAHANGYQYSTSDEYYWRAYQCFGDGSVMPYVKEPAPNNVSHAEIIFLGANEFMVNADPGSYVSITKDNEILGVAVVPAEGIVNVPVTPLTSGGEVMVVVTRQQRQPYIHTIQAIAPEGPYICLDNYTPRLALVGENTDLTLTLKNMGVEATDGTTTVTLSSDNPNVTIVSGTEISTFETLAPNASTEVSGFQFCLNSGVTLGSKVLLHYTAVNGDNTWEGNIAITPNQIFTVTVAPNNDDYGTVSGSGDFDYNTPCTVTAIPAEGYLFTSWTANGTIVSTDAEYTFNVTHDTDLTANFSFGVTIGDGTETSDYLPSYSYYKQALSEQIYTPADLGGAGIINAFAFYNAGAEKTRTYDIYMKSTAKNKFNSTSDWIAVTADDKVFSGSVTMVADDWTFITLTTPFLYDGISNVVLVTDDNSGNYTNSPHMSCRVFNAASQTIYKYDDNTNFNPANPSSVTGTVLNVKNQLIVLKELSADSYNITATASPVWGGTVTGSGEYSFGDNCTLTATPAPGFHFTGWTEYGQVISTELEYNFSVFKDRAFVATFMEGSMAGEGEETAQNSHLPSTNNYKYSLTQQLYTPDEIGTAGTINAIAFYNNGAEKTRNFDMYLVHTDKSEFTGKADWITVEAKDKVFSGDVNMVAGNWTTITLDTPFAYDGTSNLAVVIDDNSASKTTSPHMACLVYTTSSRQALYKHSDSDFNPLEPPTTTSSNSSLNGVLTVKNQLLFTIVNTAPAELTLTNDGADNESIINAAAASGKTFNVKLSDRTLYKDGEWNTICLPFNVTLADSPLADATAKSLTDASMDGTYVSLTFGNPDSATEPVTELQAGVPYIIRWESGDDIVEPVFSSVQVVSTTLADRTVSFADGQVKFIGYYDAFAITADDTDIYYMTTGSKLKHTANNRTLKSCRAYFQFTEGATPAKFMLDFGDETTGIVENNREKVANNRWSTIDGKLLQQQPTRKGVYIHNGVKVVIK